MRQVQREIVFGRPRFGYGDRVFFFDAPSGGFLWGTVEGLSMDGSEVLVRSDRPRRISRWVAVDSLEFE